MKRFALVLIGVLIQGAKAQWHCLGPLQDPEPLYPISNAIGPQPPTLGIVISTAIHPSNPVLWFIGTRHGGLWHAHQNHLQWQNLTQSIPFPIGGIYQIIIPERKANEIYILTRCTSYDGTFYRSALFRSQDTGKTWQNITPKLPSIKIYKITAIGVHPKKPYLLVGCIGILQERFYAMLLGSKDNGKTWHLLFSLHRKENDWWEVPKRIVHIAFLPANPDVVFVSTDASTPAIATYYCDASQGCQKFCSDAYSGVAGAEVWYTTHLFRRRWKKIESLRPLTQCANYISLATSKAAPEVVFVAFTKVHPSSQCLCPHPTAGYTFILKIDTQGKIRSKELHNNLVLSRIFPAFAVSPADSNRLYITGANRYLFYSTDGGKTFHSPPLRNIHVDLRSIAVHNRGGKADTLLLGHDGGVTWATFDGKQWQWKNVNGKGLAITEFHGFHVWDSTLLAGGTQDNGLLLYDKGKWYIHLKMDGGATWIDSSTLWVHYPCCPTWASRVSLYIRKKERWEAKADFSLPIPSSLKRHPMQKKGAFLYIGIGNQLWRKTQKGNWERLATFPEAKGLTMQDFVIAPSDSNVMYVLFSRVTYQAENTPIGVFLYRSDDGGKHWMLLSDTANKAFPVGLHAWFGALRIAVHENNPYEIYLSGGNIESQTRLFRVLRSIDGGKTWYVDFSQNLPPAPISALLYKNDTLFAACVEGVYYRTRTMQQWRLVGDFYPLKGTPVTNIAYKQGRLWIATYGRGIWYYDFRK